MKKVDVKTQFIREYEGIYFRNGRKVPGADTIALCLDWSHYTYALCKDGVITDRQYNTWTCPF